MQQKIEEILRPKGKLFEDTLKLIQESLSEGEVSRRREFIDVLNLKNSDKLRPDNYHFLTYEESSKIMAASCGYYISDINMGLIHYLVVHKDLQSRGTGRLMRASLLNCFDRDAQSVWQKPAEGYLGEVKMTNPWLKILEEKYRIFPMDIDYYQPELRKGEGDILLVLYYQSRERPVEFLTVGEVITIVTSIYRNVYDIQDVSKNKSYKKIIRSLKSKTYITRKQL